MCCLVLAYGVDAQTIEQCFFQMPIDLLPTLPVSSRKDLVDFYKNDRTAVMPASFSNQMTLKQLGSDYLLLQTSASTTMQLKRLPVNDTLNILTLIYTAGAPLSDSQIRFYSTTWKPLDSFAFPALTALDFLDTAGAGVNLTGRFSQVCQRLFIQMKASPEKQELSAITSIREDVPAELLEPFKPWVKDTVTLRWRGSGFIK